MKRIAVSIIVASFILAQPAPAYSNSNLAKLEKLFLDGKYNTVISEADELIRSGGLRKDELYYLKALSELKGSRFANARDSFNYIIDHYPGSPRAFDARLGIGDSYFLEGNNTKALGIYSDMAGRYPQDKNIAIVYGRLSICCSKMGARDKADSYQKMVKDMAPDSFEARSALPVEAGSVRPAVRKAAASGAVEVKYSVQVGSFKNKRNAEKLVRKLTAKGYKSYISIPVLSSDKFYRVKVGNVSSQSEASGLASRLKSEGYNTKLCAEDVCE